MDWGEVISPGYIVCGTGEANSIFLQQYKLCSDGW